MRERVRERAKEKLSVLIKYTEKMSTYLFTRLRVRMQLESIIINLSQASVGLCTFLAFEAPLADIFVSTCLHLSVLAS